MPDKSLPNNERDQIVVVDDQQHHIDFAVQNLVDAGILKVNIRTFTSSPAAIAYLQGDTGKKVLAVITDLHMPEKSGVSVIRAAIENAGVLPSNIFVYSSDCGQVEACKQQFKIDGICKTDPLDRRETRLLSFGVQVQS